MAEAWIHGQQQRFDSGDHVGFAITLRGDGSLIGSVTLDIDRSNNRAEADYWIGVGYWNHGYGTEALRTVLDYGFRVLDLNRILAMHMVRNPASGRVMEKAGMTYEGVLRQHLLKWGKFEDFRVLAVLRSEWL